MFFLPLTFFRCFCLALTSFFRRLLPCFVAESFLLKRSMSLFWYCRSFANGDAPDQIHHFLPSCLSILFDGCESGKAGAKALKMRLTPHLAKTAAYDGFSLSNGR